MTALLRLLVLFAWLLMAAAAPAYAGISNAPGANLQVALITYGPGETYWERFGHNAIELRDTVSGESVNFNYGVFDFEEKGFMLNFARGRMRYLMDAARSADDVRAYADYGRSVVRQQLALNAEQAAALRDFLLWNLRPENVGYDYDYYIDNCSTRVRDALNAALGGILKARLSERPGGLTYRQQTARLMSAQPWLMVLMDLGLGPYADQPLNAWQESFLPVVLQHELRTEQVGDGLGGSKPLVESEQVISPGQVQEPPATAPDLLPPLALAGVAFAATLVGARRRWPTGFVLLGRTYLCVAGLAGVVLLGLWLLTTHHAAWANANLLLFNPLAFALLPSVSRARHGTPPTRVGDALLVAQLLAMLTALLLHALPGITQQNQPWLLFAMPCWLALAWCVRQRS